MLWVWARAVLRDVAKPRYPVCARADKLRRQTADLELAKVAPSPWPEALNPDHSDTRIHRFFCVQSRLLVNSRHLSVESEALVDERL
jgi:hypothetical protein